MDDAFISASSETEEDGGADSYISVIPLKVFLCYQSADIYSAANCQVGWKGQSKAALPFVQGSRALSGASVSTQRPSAYSAQLSLGICCDLEYLHINSASKLQRNQGKGDLEQDCLLNSGHVSKMYIQQRC